MLPSSGIKLRPFVDVDDTVKTIYGIVNDEYSKDYMKSFDGWNLKKIFNYVSALPYVSDPKNDALSGYDDIEFVKSPYYTNYFGGDCDDKACFIGSIMKRQGIPYRFAVVSTLADGSLHHIYPEIVFDNYWVPFDATYSHNTPFTEQPFTRKRIYDDTSGQLRSFEITENSSATHTAISPQEASLSGGSSQVMLGSAGIGTLQGNANINQRNNDRLLMLITDTPRAGIRNINSVQKKPCCSCCAKKKQVRSILDSINNLSVSDIALHAAPLMLGVDPGTVGSIISQAISIFGSLFGHATDYVDASAGFWALQANVDNVFHQYPDVLHSPTAIATLASNRAKMAVLRREVMNGPIGKNICAGHGTFADDYYCGNRAMWSAVEPSVNTIAAQFLPYMTAVHLMDRDLVLPAAYKTPHYDETTGPGMVNVYNDWVSHSGAYSQVAAYAAQHGINLNSTAGSGTGTGTNNNQGTNPNTGQPYQTAGLFGGLSGTTILIGAAAAFAMYELSKKKKRSAK